MPEPSFLGPKLTPPQGGLQRLQHALHTPSRRRLYIRTWVAAGITAGLVAVSLISVLCNATQQRQMAMSVRQALTAAPQTHFQGSAFQVLPSRDPNVQILLVGSLPSAQVSDSATLQN